VDQAAVQWSKVTPAYRRYYERARGGRRDRVRSDDDWWAWEAVAEAARTGQLPLPVLEALVCDPGGDSDYRVYVGAGPLEDLLRGHPNSYAETVAERAGTSAAWAETLTGVWLDHTEWMALPERLRSRMPRPHDGDPAD
jgi:hypothetical protein